LWHGKTQEAHIIDVPTTTDERTERTRAAVIDNMSGQNSALCTELEKPLRPTLSSRTPSERSAST
jgi:hypothetical protein